MAFQPNFQLVSAGLRKCDSTANFRPNPTLNRAELDGRLQVANRFERAARWQGGRHRDGRQEPVLRRRDRSRGDGVAWQVGLPAEPLPPVWQDEPDSGQREHRADGGLRLADIERPTLVITDIRCWAATVLSYFFGQRISETLAVKIRDLNGRKNLLYERPGKGSTECMTPILPKALDCLRGCQEIILSRPMSWIFCADSWSGRSAPPSPLVGPLHSCNTTNG